MNTSEVVYTGELRTQATHLFSGTNIYTDAPLDNQGKSQNFSPSDLVATALASCMMTLMGIAARTHNINIDKTRAEVVKVMAADPRRISEIKIRMSFPSDYSDKEKAILERAALTCPVAKSLHTDIKQDVTFYYERSEK